jgi:hypothetical protein
VELEHGGRRPPAIIGLLPKSRFGPGAEDRAMRSAIQAARGCVAPVPVVFGNRILGIVKARSFWDPTIEVYRVPWNVAGYTSYNDIINSITQGQRLPTFWCKTPTTAGVANNWYDLWGIGGLPQAGVYTGTAFTAQLFDDTSTGSLATGGNQSPKTKHMLVSWVNSSGGTPCLMIVDLTMSYDQCTFNAAANQVLTNGVTMARYNGAGLSGCMASIVCTTVENATAANLTQFRYTDQDGNALQSMPTTTTVSFIVSAAAPTATLPARVVCPATAAATVPWGAFVPMATGDTGMRLVNDYTTSAANTGKFSIRMVRPLAYLPVGTAGIPSMQDHVMMIASLERLYDGCCVNCWMMVPTATGTTLNGGIDIGWN